MMQDSWRQLLRSTLSHEDGEFGDEAGEEADDTAGVDARAGLGGSGLPDGEVTRYIEDRLAGKEPAEALPHLTSFLTQYPDFLAQHPDTLFELEELVASFEADRHAVALEPLTPPSYTLDFLKPPPPPIAQALPAQTLPAHPFPPVGVTAMRAGVNWLLDQAGQFWFDMAGAAARFSPGPALVTRGGPEKSGTEKGGTEKGEAQPQEQVIQRLVWTPEELGDLDLEVKAVRDRNASPHAGHCTLQITVRVPSRWPSQEGIGVTLLYADGGHAADEEGILERSAITNEEGVVIFDHFPLQAWPGVFIRIAIGEIGEPADASE